jgi:hypothetical protein
MAIPQVQDTFIAIGMAWSPIERRSQIGTNAGSIALSGCRPGLTTPNILARYQEFWFGCDERGLAVLKWGHY